MQDTRDINLLGWQETIATRIPTLTSEEIKLGVEPSIDKSLKKNESKFFKKTALTGGLYGIFFGAKLIAKSTLQMNTINNVEAGIITPQEGLLNILDSVIGHQDKYSTKFIIVKNIFGVNANNDEEAKKMINYTIDNLKHYINSPSNQGSNSVNSEESDMELEKRNVH